jgi:hypothetical protein
LQSLKDGNLKISVANRDDVYFELASLDFLALTERIASMNVRDLLEDSFNPEMRFNSSLVGFKMDLPCMESILDSPMNDNYNFSTALINTVNCFGDPIGFHVGDLAFIDQMVCSDSREEDLERCVERITFIRKDLTILKAIIEIKL